LHLKKPFEHPPLPVRHLGGYKSPPPLPPLLPSPSFPPSRAESISRPTQLPDQMLVHKRTLTTIARCTHNAVSWYVCERLAGPCVRERARQTPAPTAAVKVRCRSEKSKCGDLQEVTQGRKTDSSTDLADILRKFCASGGGSTVPPKANYEFYVFEKIFKKARGIVSNTSI